MGQVARIINQIKDLLIPLTDLYSELNEIKDILYLIGYTEEGDKKPRISRYKIHYAIDFYDLYFYLYPEEIMHGKFGDKDRKEIIKRLTISECLFSDFFSNFVLTLLPPYEVELYNKIRREIKHANYIYGRFSDGMINNINRWSNVMINSPTMTNISNKLSVGTDLSDEDVDNFIKFCKLNLQDVFWLSTLTDYSSFRLLNDLKDRSKLLNISELALNDFNMVSIQEQAREYWFDIMKAERTEDKWWYSNYADSLALSYTAEINKIYKIKKQKDVFILVTSSEAMMSAAIKAKQNAQIFLDEIKNPIRFVKKPTLLLTFLVFLKDKDDLKSTVIHINKSLEILDKLSDINAYMDIVNEQTDNDRKTLLLNEYEKTLLEINSIINLWQNLQFANKTPKLLNEIENKFILRQNTLLENYNKRLKERVVSILNLLKQDNIQEVTIPNEIQNIFNSFNDQATDISLRTKILSSKFKMMRSPLISYMISFNDKQVNNIYNQLLKGNEKEINIELEKLLKLMKEEPNNPEVYLLNSYLFEKERNNEYALNQIEKCESLNTNMKVSENIIFIKNMILGNNDKTITDAIKTCNKMIDKNPKISRYYTQKGFFICREIFWKGLYSPHTYDDAIKALIQAKRLTRSKKELRLIICDLIHLYYNRGDFHKVLSEYEELKSITRKIKASLLDSVDSIYYKVMSYNVDDEVEKKKLLDMSWEKENSVMKELSGDNIDVMYSVMKNSVKKMGKTSI